MTCPADDIEAIVNAASKLPADERLAIAERLLESLPAAVPLLSTDDPDLIED